MTVSIGVSADPSAVTSAFDQIRAAIKRADQEGKDFAKLDLSHPELRNLAEDIKRITANFETLSRVGRGGSAAAIRRGGFVSPLDWYDRARMMFPDARDLDRHLQMAGTYMLRGTSFEPGAFPGVSLPTPAAPAPQAARPAPAPAQHRGGGALGTLMEGAIGGASAATGFLFAAAMGGGIMSALSGGVSRAQQESVSTDQLMRRLGPLSSDFFGLRDAVRQATTGLQLTYGEAQKLSMAWARLTNETNTGRLASAVRFATGFARGYGISPDAATATLGQAAYLGEDPRRFAAMIGDAVNAGHQTGQVEQVMSALLNWSQAASRFIVTGTDVGAFASMYAGLNATGLPGLKGQNAVSLIGQINNAVMQGGGGGMAGQALTFRAFANYGITDPYQIQFMQRQGMFTRMGPGGPTIFEAERSELNREYSSLPNYQRWFAGSTYFGISPAQYAALEKFHYGDIGPTQSLLQRYGMSLDKVNPTSIMQLAALAHAHGSQLDAFRSSFLGRQDVTSADRASLAGLSGNALREQLTRLTAKYGMQQTEGTRVMDSMAKLTDAIQAATTGLIPVLTSLRDSVDTLTKPIQWISTELDWWFGSRQQGTAGPGSVNSSRWAMGVGTMTPGTSAALAARSLTHLSAQQRQNEDLAYQAALKAGATPAGAAAFAAQFYAEGAFQAHPGRNGGSDSALQMLGRRVEYYGQWAKMRGLDPNIEHATFQQQVQEALWELRTYEANHSSFLHMASARAAGANASMFWIRPRDQPGQASARAAEAAEILRQHQKPLPAGGHQQTVHVVVSAHPIQVQHITPTGEHGRTEYVPVQAHTSKPVPSGAKRDPGPLTLAGMGVSTWGVGAHAPPLPTPPEPPPWAP